MSREVKGFIVRDDFISSSNTVVSPVYELSDIGLTYAKNKLQYYSSLDQLYSMYVFKLNGLTGLNQTEVNDIINVVKKFSEFLTSNFVVNKQQSIILFVNMYNSQNPTKTITDFNYNTIISHNNIKTTDYITFNIYGIVCNFWLSDLAFRTFYPEYDISIVLPFNNFASIVSTTNEFVTAIDNFNLIEFNRRIEENKSNIPPTYTRIINIPYRVPNTSIMKNVYFAFNIYGSQGNYDHILKLKLYDMFINTLNLNSAFIENVFPTILNINEFFIIPRWDKVAIPSQVGQVGINSQISLSYNEPFNINKFIKVYNNTDFLRRNTYNVPFDYNNILLQITNGYYTEPSIRDFANYYSDFITVTSTHPDFSRMRQRTQRFITLLENMLSVADSGSSAELFNKISGNSNYRFTIISRSNISYLSFFFEEHYYYVIPRYEYFNNL